MAPPSQHDIEEILTEAISQAASRRTNKTLAPKNGNQRPHECAVDECERPAYARGLCNAHYIRQRNGKSMDVPLRHRGRNVRCAECDEILDGSGGWGLCKSHYNKERHRVLKLALLNAFGGKCNRCDGVFPVVAFDFHHLSGKDESMANLINNCSPERISKEAVKCIPVCANCHRIIHFEETENVNV